MLRCNACEDTRTLRFAKMYFSKTCDIINPIIFTSQGVQSSYHNFSTLFAGMDLECFYLMTRKDTEME